MLISFAIVSLQIFSFIAFLSETALYTVKPSDQGHALFAGVALFTAFISVPLFIWNYQMLIESKRKRDIIGTIAAVVTVVLAFGFLIFDCVYRIHDNGARIF